MDVAQKALRGAGSRDGAGTAIGTVLRRLTLAFSLAGTAVLVSGCSIDNVWLRFGWLSGVTPQARRMRELWTWSVIAALVMGVLVWGLIFWTVIFHRKRAGQPEFPRQTAYNVPLELGYTAAPFVIIAVLFYFTVVVQDYVHEKVDNPNVVVDVTAFQWNWKFGYRSVDLSGTGREDLTNHDRERQAAAQANEAKERRNDNGHPQPGPIHGKDKNDLSYLHYDKVETVGSSDEIPVLVLPTQRVIEFQIASADVIHAFWVPEFLFKRDVNPNPKENHSDNVFQISKIEREGAFVGRCAEMCGTYHAMMNFEVRAVSPDKFQRYLEARKRGATNAEALGAINEPATAVTTKPYNTERTARKPSS